MVLLLALLTWFSLHLAAMRIIQVDECNNMFVAKILATGQAKSTLGAIDIFQIPLSWLARGTTRSIDLFTSARFVMFELFWLNLILIALATGEKLLSQRGIIALAFAATLAPLWDYGFEIRHDNVLLTGVLLIWCSIRTSKPMPQAYVLAGVVTVFLQFVAFKAFVYTLPICVGMVLFPPPGISIRRWKLASLWLAGALGVFLAVRIWYGQSGLWEIYLTGSRGITAVSTGCQRFGAWFPLNRLLEQTPLLLAVVVAASATLIVALGRLPKKVFSWEAQLPEAMLFFVALGALIVNPTPFPYNLVNFVPYAFIFAYRYISPFWSELWRNPVARPVLFSVVIFAHFVPFAIATQRHSQMSNNRQEKLMTLAEALADPTRDPVYDGIGMVPTRAIIHPRSFLHSLNIQSFISGPEPKLRDYLTINPAAVLIPSYRTDWLSEADHEFIRQRYVNLSDDFFVLGQQLPAGGGEIEIYHPGRYRISALKDSNIAGTYSDTLKEFLSPPKPELISGTVDETSLPDAPVELSKGKHRILTESRQPLAVVWVGPKLDRPPRPGSGDHLKLFVNWY